MDDIATAKLKRTLFQWIPGHWRKPRLRKTVPERPGHMRCPCGLLVGHGQHYYGLTPQYHCECGFHSSRKDELIKHLKTGKGRVPEGH